MINHSHTEQIAPTLNDLVNDNRLKRLFTADGKCSALQLWVLQIKSGGATENRIIYGRLLPYSHSSNRWSASDSDKFRSFGQVQAQVAQLNLYINSDNCAELLQKLSAGRTISEISEELNFELSEKIKKRFGATSIVVEGLAYRPAAYLLNRDAHDRHSLPSPHSGAGAFSASITQIDKKALFRIGQHYDVALTEAVVKHLNAHTGLDFGGVDVARFGDLELVVFPALDDQERSLLSVSWTDDPLALTVRFNPMQVAEFNGFQFRLSIANSNEVSYTCIAAAERDEQGVFECKFVLGDQSRARIDSTELEIFGFEGDQSRHGMLCCRWRMGYIRSVDLQIHAVGQGANPVKFDWLEKTIRKSEAERMAATLTLNRGNQSISNRIGGRDADPWVGANRDLTSLFARLHPPKSEGNFFLRWCQGDNGRLQFVEWFKTLLAKYQEHQLVIFDPYFEDAGLGLLLLSAAPKADYIVFTSLPKPSKNSGATTGESTKPGPSRINNLMASCEHNSHLLQRIKLRIFGLNDGRLHDRYILVMAPDGLPVAGFNLSNSFQKAAENHPLLITPIPTDTLLKVEVYMSGLIQEANAAQPDDEVENASMQLLFDSVALASAPRRYEPLPILENAQAGSVLSIWNDEPSLQGLCGNPLKERMAALGLLKGDTLSLPDTASLPKFLAVQTGNFTDFTTTWEVLGDLLAHSQYGDQSAPEVQSECRFLQFLAQFLRASFKRKLDETDNEWAVMPHQFFRKSLEELLRSSYRPDQLFHPTKYAALTWAEYYAIKFLWWYAPDALLEIADFQMASIQIEPQASDVVQLSLLSQIVSEISLSIEFSISEVQRDNLIHSKNGLLQWMGLNAIERVLKKHRVLDTALELIAEFHYPKKVNILGWMVSRAAQNPETVEVYNGLVLALHEALPTPVPKDDLRMVIDSMRGHMHQLGWAGKWLFRDIILPLLQNDRVSTDDACEIWIQELTDLLQPKIAKQSPMFDQSHEGLTTNIAAFLFAQSGTERQLASLDLLKAILKRQRRIVQQPLSSTSNWTLWNDALMVSMWILTFTRWSQYYLGGRGMTHPDLKSLSQASHELAMIRPIDKWWSQGIRTQRELIAFLKQAEDLLLSGTNRNSS